MVHFQRISHFLPAVSAVGKFVQAVNFRRGVYFFDIFWLLKILNKVIRLRLRDHLKGFTIVNIRSLLTRFLFDYHSVVLRNRPYLLIHQGIVTLPLFNAVHHVLLLGLNRQLSLLVLESLGDERMLSYAFSGHKWFPEVFASHNKLKFK